MSDLYFSPVNGSAFDTSDNWFYDAEFTNPTGQVPQPGDNVNIGFNCNAPAAPFSLGTINLTGGAFSGQNITGVDLNVSGTAYLDGGAGPAGTIISGTATFSDSTYLSTGVISCSDVLFKDFSYCALGADIVGNATFTSEARNLALLANATLTFKGSSANFGTVITARFEEGGHVEPGGVVGGTATFTIEAAQNQLSVGINNGALSFPIIESDGGGGSGGAAPGWRSPALVI